MPNGITIINYDKMRGWDVNSSYGHDIGTNWPDKSRGDSVVNYNSV